MGPCTQANIWLLIVYEILKDLVRTQVVVKLYILVCVKS